MTPLTRLTQMLKGQFPTATISIDEPLKPEGYWFLDITLGDRAVNIEWRPERGFGVSWAGEGATNFFGSGPSTTFTEQELEGACKRVAHFLTATVIDLSER